MQTLSGVTAWLKKKPRKFKPKPSSPSFHLLLMNNQYLNWFSLKPTQHAPLLQSTTPSVPSQPRAFSWVTSPLTHVRDMASCSTLTILSGVVRGNWNVPYWRAGKQFSLVQSLVFLHLVRGLLQLELFPIKRICVLPTPQLWQTFPSLLCITQSSLRSAAISLQSSRLKQ